VPVVLARRRDNEHVSVTMDHGHWLAAALVAGVFLFQVFVTYRLWRTQVFERAQKVAQSKLVWLLPMLGAVIVFSMLSDEERHVRDDGNPKTHLRS
jgi:Kef-type K+ transport system membrane component KefB